MVSVLAMLANLHSLRYSSWTGLDAAAASAPTRLMDVPAESMPALVEAALAAMVPMRPLRDDRPEASLWTLSGASPSAELSSAMALETGERSTLPTDSRPARACGRRWMAETAGPMLDLGTVDSSVSASTTDWTLALVRGLTCRWLSPSKPAARFLTCVPTLPTLAPDATESSLSRALATAWTWEPFTFSELRAEKPDATALSCWPALPISPPPTPMRVPSASETALTCPSSTSEELSAEKPEPRLLSWVPTSPMPVLESDLERSLTDEATACRRPASTSMELSAARPDPRFLTCVPMGPMLTPESLEPSLLTDAATSSRRFVSGLMAFRPLRPTDRFFTCVPMPSSLMPSRRLSASATPSTVVGTPLAALPTPWTSPEAALRSPVARPTLEASLSVDLASLSSALEAALASALIRMLSSSTDSSAMRSPFLGAQSLARWSATRQR